MYLAKLEPTITETKIMAAFVTREENRRDEAAHSNRSTETQVAFVQHLRQHDGEDDNTERGTGNGEGHGSSSSFLEILRDGSHGRKHGWTGSKTVKDPLGELEVPVFGAKTRYRDDDIESSCRADNVELVSTDAIMI